MQAALIRFFACHREPPAFESSNGCDFSARRHFWCCLAMQGMHEDVGDSSGKEREMAPVHGWFKILMALIVALVAFVAAGFAIGFIETLLVLAIAASAGILLTMLIVAARREAY
jgi:hypothetical protein